MLFSVIGRHVCLKRVLHIECQVVVSKHVSHIVFQTLFSRWFSHIGGKALCFNCFQSLDARDQHFWFVTCWTSNSSRPFFTYWMSSLCFENGLTFSHVGWQAVVSKRCSHIGCQTCVSKLVEHCSHVGWHFLFRNVFTYRMPSRCFESRWTCFTCWV